MSAQAAGSDACDASVDDSSRIYVGNLIPKANEVHLKQLFGRFGAIHTIWVARKPPGFAFVNYATPVSAQRAVEAFEAARDSSSALSVLGKPVKVQIAGAKDKHKDKKTTGAVDEASVASTSDPARSDASGSNRNSISSRDTARATRPAERSRSSSSHHRDRERRRRRPRSHSRSSSRHRSESRRQRRRSQDRAHSRRSRSSSRDVRSRHRRHEHQRAESSSSRSRSRSSRARRRRRRSSSRSRSPSRSHRRSRDARARS